MQNVLIWFPRAPETSSKKMTLGDSNLEWQIEMVCCRSHNPRISSMDSTSQQKKPIETDQWPSRR